MITFEEYQTRLKASVVGSFEQAVAAQERLNMIMMQILDAPQYEECPSAPVLGDGDHEKFLIASAFWMESLPKELMQELVIDDFSSPAPKGY